MDLSYLAVQGVVIARCRERLRTEQNTFARLQPYVAQHRTTRLLLDFRWHGDLPYSKWEELFRNLIPKLSPVGYASPWQVALLGLPSQQAPIELHLPAPYFQGRQGYQAQFFVGEAEALRWLQEAGAATAAPPATPGPSPRLETDGTPNMEY